MNIPKDVYEYIAQFADDRTILKMLTVNKELEKNDKLFERVLIRKYPLLMKFKKENETWKNLYIRMTYYISKLEEEYGIPYIDLENYNPEIFYQKNKNKFNIYDLAMANAARAGDMNIINLMIEKGARNFNEGLKAASGKGHIEIVKFFLDKGADKLMCEAAKNGHIEIVNLLIERGASNFNYNLTCAAYGGHIDIVKLMIEKGADDFNYGLLNAAWSGNPEIIKLMLKNGADFGLVLDDMILEERRIQEVIHFVEKVIPFLDQDTINFAIENAIQLAYQYDIDFYVSYLEEFL